MVGKGGMAEVYRAKVLSGPRAGWTVALKRLSPELAKDPANVDLFAGEADLSRFLDHPNIVKVFEAGVIGEVYFMVMELIDGRDLGQVLKRCKQAGVKLPVDFAVFIARTMLDALAYAHEAKGPTRKPLGIVHGDVSPSNVFISRTGEIKLGDFGSARARGLGSDSSMIAGKPYYLSPEMLEGDVTIQGDLWGVCVTLYELLTLERPFTGETPEEVFAAIKKRKYRSPSEQRPEVPSEIELLIARGFAMKPEDRFPSAAAFGSALDGQFDPNIGTPLGIAAVVRGLFGAEAAG